MPTPGLYVACANVLADGFASITTPLSDHVDKLARLVRADPKLAHGFHAVGLSQGRLVLRDFVEVYNLPPERRFVSVCTPHEGIGICPEAYQMVCHCGSSRRTRRGSPSPTTGRMPPTSRHTSTAHTGLPNSIMSSSLPY